MWDFSINRTARNGENVEELVENIQKYLDTQETIKITYREPMCVWPWRAGTRDLIQDIEPITERNQ
ncbi:hypothetical protein J4456_02265 [Candidatus Pacearchaeota archaeon]|nr:hypothetical protein [Candidatus Pacearchaeota archaeon]